MTSLVDYKQADGIATITLTNPPANAYSYEMFEQFDAAILTARMAKDVFAIVVTGQGDKFFCAGADIDMLSTADPQFKYYFCLHANETLQRLENTPKLVIAVINGHCVGGGLEIAMACDLRLARQGKAKFGLPEVALGVLPGTGGTQRLSRLIGKAKAIELMVTGKTLSVQKAFELGLITQIFEENDFTQQVTKYVADLCPPNTASYATGLIKRAVHSGSELSLDAGLAVERELQQRLFTSQDAKEGLAAYMEKRKPEFLGR